MKNKFKYANLVYITLIIIFSLSLIYSSIKIFWWYKSNKENTKIKDEISDFIEVEEPTDIEGSIETEESTVKYKVDFTALKEMNTDVVAYLKVNNTKIDYVVVRGKDNSYYLKHNLNKEYNFAGWIFSDYRNKFDETDKNIVIFGHDTKDGSMFGSLKNILNSEWYDNEENMDVILVTENGTYIYKVFSVYKIKNEEYYINTVFNSEREYSNFLNTIKNRSIKNFNIELNSDDKILTLSTCANGGINRIVLHAKLDSNK